MTKRRVFIGDLHGRLDLFKQILEIEREKNSEIFLVGDYVDSFNVATITQKETLRLVLDLVKEGKIKALLGNHELSYLFPEVHRCSGYNQEMDRFIGAIREEMLANLLPFIYLEEGNILVTHAGLNNLVYDLLYNESEEKDKNTISMSKMLLRWFYRIERDSPVHYIGQSRGGNYWRGGIFWDDANMDFQAVPGLNQIFGHTPQKKGVLQIGNGLLEDNTANFCIDSLGYGVNEYLVLENGVFSIVELSNPFSIKGRREIR